MSGGGTNGRTLHEMTYELRLTKEQRRRRARLLPLLYALCDPFGYDARKLTPRQRAILRLGAGIRELSELA